MPTNHVKKYRKDKGPQKIAWSKISIYIFKSGNEIVLKGKVDGISSIMILTRQGIIYGHKYLK